MLRLLITVFLIFLASSTQAESGRADYDLDNDGLIEINDLADLNEIRNNLDGTSLYGSSDGCPAEGCTGFELTTDLDFDTNGDGVINQLDNYWNDGEGWKPIGSNLVGKAFRADFNGRGYLIKNLYIHRPNHDYQALFGVTSSASIYAVGLTGPLMQITGDTYTGGLVGSARSSKIQGTFSTGKIRSYNAHAVIAGGLIGELDESELSHSFSAAEVTVDEWYTGGLVSIYRDSDIGYSYSTAWLSGAQWQGGIAGYGPSDGAVGSYWAEDVAGTDFSEGGHGATLEELQCPTKANEEQCSDIILYEGWERENSGDDIYWDFGTESELPGLVLYGTVYRDRDGDGVLDEDDAYPGVYAAAADSDGDGAIDRWSPACDEACRESSNLVLDQFPENPAASIDTDLDGKPDEWNSDCGSGCRNDSGLELDTLVGDADNDGIPDASDSDLNDDGATDADADSNGLVDIHTLEQLNAVRHNYSGTGRRLTEGGPIDESGCPAVIFRGKLQRRCFGYELKSDLNFDTNGDGKLDENDEYWNDGKGWQPIDGDDTEFRVLFHGNGHLVQNLYINRPEESSVGLFGQVRNIEIKALGAAGPLTRVEGQTYVGSLVGYAEDVFLEGVFSTGSVFGMEGQSNSYAGGLVGSSIGGQIMAAFFTGSVVAEGKYAGGIVGELAGTDLRFTFASGRVQGEGRYSGLAISGNWGNVNESYWMDRDADYLTGGNAVGHGVSLVELQCASSGSSANCQSTSIYGSWPQAVDSSGEPYWDYGGENQLPALVLKGKTYRDSDGDGTLDPSDDFPNDHDNDGVPDANDAFALNRAASVDIDGDGRPGRWNEGCGAQCQADSGLSLDPDRDGDGVDNGMDAFPTNPAASVDTDGDGAPDYWNESCETQCQNDSGLELDPDRDGDGVDNGEDAFPSNPAASVDADEDGLPDVWHQSCGTDCQQNSGLTLDEHPNDTDNDGVANPKDHYPTDPNRWQDDVAPEMVLVPAPMHVASTGELTEVTLIVEDARGYDSFSESVDFRVYHNEEPLTWDDENRVELPVGRATLNWVAVDGAGNESAPMPQIVNVYPQVRFAESESATGEGNSALVEVSLSGPSPVYPVTLNARWVEAESTASTEDVRTNGEGSVDLSELSAVIESEQALAEAGFVVPIAQDEPVETDEQLVLTLQAAYAGEEAEEGEEGRFEMPLVEEGTSHTLTITEANLAPRLELSLEQDGQSVEVVRQGGGEVAVEATITDPNNQDEHQLEWYTSDLPFVVNNTERRFSFDPADLDEGEYSISALVTDNGNPALSSEEVILAWDVEAASDEPGEETEGNSGEETNENSGDETEEDVTEEDGTGEEPAGNDPDQSGQGNAEDSTGDDSGADNDTTTPAPDNAGGGSSGGGGSIHLGALALLLMLAAARAIVTRGQPPVGPCLIRS